MIHDLAIVGAGPVAASLALRFGAAGFRCALVGPVAQTQPLPQVGFDARVFALSPASVAWLAQSRLWAGVDLARVARVQQMQVADPNGQVLCFSADDAADAQPLAYTIEHANLLNAAAAAMKFSALTTVSALATGITQCAGYAQLECDGGPDGGTSVIQARLIVGADGANSTVRSAAAIGVSRKPYEQSAVIANFVSNDASLPGLEAGYAYQWFTGQAILALLPLPHAVAGRRFSIVWSCAPQRALALQADPQGLVQAMVAELQKHDPAIARLVARFVLESEVHQIPLALQSVSSLVAERVCLVGDAAHVVHPLCGQGMNLGFGDAAALFEVVSGREPLRDPGDAVLLRRYARRRAEAIATMRLTTDGLARAFDSDLSVRYPLFAGARDLGWRALETLPWAKKIMMAQAMR